MKWSSSEISEPMTKALAKEFHPVAIQLFRSKKVLFILDLLSYMLDRKSSKKPIEHAKKFLLLTMNASQELKDESYVQVLKQIKDHKDSRKAIRGWNFLAILASCYIPSNELFFSILNYLYKEIKDNTNEDIVHHANYVFIRLYKSFDLKRANIPYDNELQHIEVDFS